jgi:uncharacterized damage-inducible protein DinB
VNTVRLVQEIYDDLSADERSEYERILRASDDMTEQADHTFDSISATAKHLSTTQEKYDHVSRTLAAVEAQSENFKQPVADLDRLIRNHPQP